MESKQPLSALLSISIHARLLNNDHAIEGRSSDCNSVVYVLEEQINGSSNSSTDVANINNESSVLKYFTSCAVCTKTNDSIVARLQSVPFCIVK